jgi:hypothetical protein
MKNPMTSLALVLSISAIAMAQENTYLEIPIEGRFGAQVTALGLENALQTAKCMGVKHIVFVVDSKGGDQLTGRDMYNLLGKFDKDFRYHAVVREATGVSMAVIVWCDPVFIRPGGSIGGVNLVIDEARYSGVDTSVVLGNLALNAGEEAKRHGQSAELVRAMIDPAEAVYGWKDSLGRCRISRWLPSDISSRDFIVQHQSGKVLTLTDQQAVGLEFARSFEGKIEDLGCELGLSDWVSAGDAGRNAMEDTTRADQAKALTGDRHDFLVRQNQRRREATKAAIERFLKLAGEWNPNLGTYSTSREWVGFWDGWTAESKRLTPEARLKWRDRTDIALAALSKAHGGIREMRELEKEAKALGLESFYTENRLDEIRIDVELKIAMLVREREKRFRDER